MRPALRRLWLQLHRWIALSFGWLLALVALLGAALVVAPALDRWANPQLFHSNRAPGAATAPMEPIRQHLLAEFGPSSSLTLRPPRQADDTLWVRVRGGSWSGTVYFDPSTGAEQGRRGQHEGAYNLLFELHSELLMGDSGKAVLTIMAAAYVLLLVGGLVLWWPRSWPPRLRVEWRQGLMRALFDLHRTAGALLGVLILVSIVTGAYMAWAPMRGWVSQLAGQAPVKAPKVAAVVDGQPPAALDELVSRAQSVFPDGAVGYIHVAGERTRPVQVRLQLPDDPHPNGRSAVYLHPVTGQVLAAQRWNELDLGARAVSVMYPLHTGTLGGPVHEVLTALVGLSLATLGGSGLWLWWRRRRR